MKEKLSDAIHQMKRGDFFDCPELDKVSPFSMNGNGVIKNKLGDSIAFNAANMNIKGEIIRAEPEVLTEDEAFENNHDPEDPYNQVFECGFESGFRTCFDIADKNGQIKEWKRLKPLIDGIGATCGIARESSPLANNVRKQLKNITPPWEVEK